MTVRFTRLDPRRSPKPRSIQLAEQDDGRLLVVAMSDRGKRRYFSSLDEVRQTYQIDPLLTGYRFA